MKNEFIIYCYCFEDACELYNEAYRHGYKYFFTGIPFTKEKFKQYNGIFHFGKDGIFCLADIKCSKDKFHSYDKQKAIDLLSCKEQFELKIDRVNPNIEQPDYYNFIFNDNHKITCHKDNDKFITKRRPEQDSRINENEHWKLIDKWFEERRKKEEIESDLVTSVKYRGEFIEIEVKGKVTFCYSKNLWEIYLKDLNKGGKFEPNLKSAIKHYEKYIKPNLNKPKLKSISVLSAAENMGPYPCAYNAEFENGINFKFYMKSPFDYEIFSEEDSILKGEYEKAVAEFIKSKNTWPVKEISKEHKLNKLLKITAASKEIYKGENEMSFYEKPVYTYTISFNDGFTINCYYLGQTKRKKIAPSKKFTITDKHLELIYDYIDKDNKISKFEENVDKVMNEYFGNWKVFSKLNEDKKNIKINQGGSITKENYTLIDNWKKHLEEVSKVVDEHMKNQQPLSHKLKVSEENSQSPFVSNQEKVIDSKDSFNKEKVYELNTILSKQLYEKNKQITALVSQHQQDLKDWRNEYTELKTKYKKRKELNKQDEQTIIKLNEKISNYKGDEIWANNIYKQIQRIFPDSKNAVSLLAWLQDKQPEEKITEHERVELKSLYEVLNESVPEFIKKASFKERVECLQSYLNELHPNRIDQIEDLKDRLQRTENEYKKLDNFYSKFKAKYPNEARVKMVQYEIIYNKLLDEYKDEIIDQYKTLINEKEIINDEALNKAVKKAAQKVNKDIDNFIDANDDLAKVPKQEAKPEKLIVKVGLMYKGRRVKDNKWLHGKLVTIKEAGEKGTVILKNEKGNHEVVYRTLIML